MKVSTGCSRDLGIAERFVAGSLAGAVAQSAIYPLEVQYCWVACDNDQDLFYKHSYSIQMFYWTF